MTEYENTQEYLVNETHPLCGLFQMNGSLMLNQGVFRGRAEYHLEGGDFVSPLKTAILCFQMQFIDPTSAGLAGIL